MATDMYALFGELPEIVKPYIPQFNYQLHDFSHRSGIEEVQALRAEIDEVSQLLEKHNVATVGERTDLSVEHVTRLRDELEKDG